MLASVKLGVEGITMWTIVMRPNIQRNTRGTDSVQIPPSDALLAQQQNQLCIKLDASRDVDHKMTKTTELLSNGEFIRECLVDSAAIIYPELKESLKSSAVDPELLFVPHVNCLKYCTNAHLQNKSR